MSALVGERESELKRKVWVKTWIGNQRCWRIRSGTSILYKCKLSANDSKPTQAVDGGQNIQELETDGGEEKTVKMPDGSMREVERQKRKNIWI